MPKNLNLTRLAESLRELAEAGSPVDISVAEVSAAQSEVEINQVGESIVFDLRYGGTGYLLDLEIINQTSKTIYCSETLELRMSWEDPLFAWLPDPRENPRKFSYWRRERNGRSKIVHATSDSYCFLGGTQLEYPRELVLNHSILQRRILAPGRPLRGLLLAQGSPLPNHLRHGQWIEPTFSLISSRHIEYTTNIRLWIDRTEAKPKSARKYNLRGEPIGDVQGVARNQPAGIRDGGGVSTEDYSFACQGPSSSQPGISDER